MASILRIEEEMGRRRVQNKGPRSIDIDILLFADAIMESKELTIPHPAMHHAPLRAGTSGGNRAARRYIQYLKKTIRELLDALPPGSGKTR